MKLRVYFIVTSLRFFLFLSSPWIIPKREASGKGGSGGKKIWSQVTVHYLLSKIIPRISLYHTAKWRKICPGTNESSRGKFSRVFTSSTFEKIICVETEWRIDISFWLTRLSRTNWRSNGVSIINHILKRFLRTNTRIKIYYLAVELFKIFMFEIGDLSTNILTLSFGCVSKKNWFSNCVNIKSLYLIKRVVRIYSFRIIHKYYY